MDYLLLRLPRPAWVKQMIYKTIYQVSKAEEVETQTMIHMNHNNTGPDSDTGNKWKAVE